MKSDADLARLVHAAALAYLDGDEYAAERRPVQLRATTGDQVVLLFLGYPATGDTFAEAARDLIGSLHKMAAAALDNAHLTDRPLARARLDALGRLLEESLERT